MRHVLLLIVVGAAVLAGCGDDDDDASDAPASTAESTTTLDAGSEVSDEFCSAFDDYTQAQDGAQLNTALGAMADALPDDAPADVQAALETLATGDLPATDYDAAGATLEGWATDACPTS